MRFNRIPLSLACLLLWLLGPITSGAAGELRILTSMPNSLFMPFADAFEEVRPDVSVVILNKNTNAAVEEIVRGNPRAFDIFWASSAEAFAVLNERGAFSGASALPDIRPSDRAGGAAFYPFALSSIGWTQRIDSALSQPNQWEDLLDPRYEGQVAMARPSRSGSTHMIVERFLQVRGWEDGWAYLLALSANLSTLTSRSFGVIDGVENRRFEIGITLDFLAQSRRENGLSFRYGRPVMVMTAQIGLLNGGLSNQDAADFIAFVLSGKGQNLLLLPTIRRVPIDAQLRHATVGIPTEITDALRLSWQPYDAFLARDRYWAVNTLFDEFVTFRLPARRAAWQRWRAMQAANDPSQAARLAIVARLLTTMPILETDAVKDSLNNSLTRITALSAPTDVQQDSITIWAAQADELLEQAVKILDELEQQERDRP